MESASHLISAIAALLWPVIVIILIFLYRADIPFFIRRLKKGKLFGQEFELDSELNGLKESAAAATVEVETLPKSDGRIIDFETEKSIDAIIKSILDVAVNTPKLALISLAAELEKQTRQALATRGLLVGRSSVPVSKGLNELARYGFPPNLSGSLSLFLDVRNKIVHGHEATDDDAIRAIDSGICILRALNSLPNEVNIVYHPGVNIFRDAECYNQIDGVCGVILETTSPGGAVKTFRIFPTTKSHFRTGKQVAWEWNMDNTWSKAWYRDPDTNEIKSAWEEAAEFIGRNIDEI